MIRLFSICAMLLISSCVSSNYPNIETIGFSSQSVDYRIGANDIIQVLVYGQPDLSVSSQVRPDGKLSLPLINDVQASNQTSSELAQDISIALREYVKDPEVTVLISGFKGRYADKIKVIGQAQSPMSLAYTDKMTLLDLMIEVGGLTPFASGNRSILVRDGNKYTARLDDLINAGDIEANASLAPGDILIIPEAIF